MSGMDPEIFDAFIDQLRRYVRERLIPAEADVIANDRIPDDILQEMRDMGLFGITIPEEFGGAGMNVSQYIETVKQLAYAAPAYRSTVSINIVMTGARSRISARLSKKPIGCRALPRAKLPVLA